MSAPFFHFSSSSSLSGGAYQLSNLALSPFTHTWSSDACVPPFHRGRTCSYQTVEHAYQSLRAATLESAVRFETGGDITMELYKKWPVGKNVYERRMRHWNKKAPGIIAKEVSNLPRGALGLAMLPKKGSPSLSFEQQMLIWVPILTSKYLQNAAARKLLASTAPYTLVEWTRHKHENNYWNAYVVKGGEGEAPTLMGANVMGRLMQLVREVALD
jgi:hypothetical protein